MAQQTIDDMIDKLNHTQGVLASAKVHIEAGADRQQAAIDAALELGATQEQVAAMQAEVDESKERADECAQAIVNNP